MNQSLLSQQAMAGVQYMGASAPPMAQPYSDDTHHDESLVRERMDAVQTVQGGLVELGVPAGLAGVVAEDDQRIGRRIYLLDNSGSTATGDGSVLVEGRNGSATQVPGTRWEEICAFTEDHARWNLTVGTPCEFVLLNSWSRVQGSGMQEGRDCLHIDRSLGDVAAQLQQLSTLLRNNGPRGVTPLVARLDEIHQRVYAEAPGLAQRGQLVFLTIVTDGLPTSPYSGTSTDADKQSFISTLRNLCANLPLQLVIRLCTDDKATVEFYNDVDEELELPLDILDDIVGEAQEVASHGNDWFAYTPTLHRIREAGTLCKMLDAIDERKLTKLEVRQLAEALCGASGGASLAGLTDRQFVREIKRLVVQAPLVYDARRRAMAHVVSINRLRAALKVGCRGALYSILRCCPFNV
mmetsp:Transcript_75922/g.246373  ORF Transcript_75922/g.246373 Transcript_75922/m.246373 type:complete len:409 (-) Transcript_75922:316-1542(-)